MKGLLLLMVAVFLKWVLLPFGVLYSIVHIFLNNDPREWYRKVDKYFHLVAYSIDQQGNVLYQNLFDKLFINSNSSNRFGEPDETISSVLGKNKITGCLSRTGKLLTFILDKIDNNHVIKSIE